MYSLRSYSPRGLLEPLGYNLATIPCVTIISSLVQLHQSSYPLHAVRDTWATPLPGSETVMRTLRPGPESEGWTSRPRWASDLKSEARVRPRIPSRAQVLTRIYITVSRSSQMPRVRGQNITASVQPFQTSFELTDITNSSISFRLHHTHTFHSSSQQNMARCASCGANPIGTGRVTYPCDNPRCDRGNLTYPCSVEGCNQGRYWAPAQRKWLTCQRCHGSGQMRSLETCHRCNGRGVLDRPCPTCLINRVSFGMAFPFFFAFCLADMPEQH